MHGVLNLLKPPGMTSHDAVAFVRRVYGTRRVGHTGTLDPAAAGVLPICVGLATRLVEDLQAGSKEYLAEATFGFETDSCDATGNIVREADASRLDLEALRGAIDTFRGEIEQTPPLHSAIKVGGRKLYELARAGEDIEIPTRRVTISEVEIVRFDGGLRPRAMLRVECSGGTYIRSLVRDIGRVVDMAATMTFLVRTRSGSFTLDKAYSLEQIEASPYEHLTPLSDVLSWCAHTVVIDDDITRDLAHGRRVMAVVSAHSSADESTGAKDDTRSACEAVSSYEGKRVLFQTLDRSLAVFAHPTAEDETVFQPDKVFDLREPAA